MYHQNGYTLFTVEWKRYNRFWSVAALQKYHIKIYLS